MKKLIFFIIVLLSSSMFLFAEKFIAQYADLKAELIPVLESPDKLSVDIILTNTTGRTCYIENVLLEFEFYIDENRNIMCTQFLLVKNEKDEDLSFKGEPSPIIFASTKWMKGSFTRLGKGKSIKRHITNLFNSYPDAKNCEYITIYSKWLKAEPVTVKLK